MSSTAAWVTSHVMIESGRLPYVHNNTMVIEIRAYNFSAKDTAFNFLIRSLNKVIKSDSQRL